MHVHRYGHAEYRYCVSLICKPKAVSKGAALLLCINFHVPDNFFCPALAATRNTDRTAKLPSPFLINILHDSQKLTK